MTTTYCILGGGGAFAVHTARYLIEQPGTLGVVGIGRAPLRPEPFSLGIEREPKFAYKPFHVGYELDMLLEYLDNIKPQVIVNFAAQGEGAASWRHSWRFFETNCVALSRLFEALCARKWLRQFLHIGTSELYGSVTDRVAEDAPIRPSSPYAASKAAFDLYLLAMAQQRLGPPMNIIRPSNCYCPGQLLHRIIPRAIVSSLRGEKVPLHGGGAARKSYLHARDLANAIYLVAEHGPAGEVYNVGPPSPTSIREVAERCAAATNRDFDELFDVAEERRGQDACYWLDSNKIIGQLGWKQTIGWDQGLQEMVEWGMRYLDQLRDWPMDYQLRA